MMLTSENLGQSGIIAFQSNDIDSRGRKMLILPLKPPYH